MTPTDGLSEDHHQLIDHNFGDLLTVTPIYDSLNVDFGSTAWHWH